jgi:hypothetical protein
MCVHMNCKQIIQVFFAPLATKDKKFTASLQSQIATPKRTKQIWFWVILIQHDT